MLDTNHTFNVNLESSLTSLTHVLHLCLSLILVSCRAKIKMNIKALIPDVIHVVF